MKNRRKKGAVIVALRLPEEIYNNIIEAVNREDIDFSKFTRRALRKELVNSGTVSAHQLAVIVGK